MTDQFVGEIRAVGYNFAPTGWALCNGQLIPISQNTALFSLLGTTYGGDGKSNFALPNLQGMAPVQQGQGPGLSLIDLGETAGETAVTLLQSEIPQHNHTIGVVNGSGSTTSPAGATFAEARVGRVSELVYGAPTSNQVPMNPLFLAPSGGSQPHNNMPPYLVLNFIIALQGIFPPRN